MELFRVTSFLLLTIALSASATAKPTENAMSNVKPLPQSASLLPEYARYNITVQQQQKDNCWAYSIVSCLDLELSRAHKQTVRLSAPYLTWAAACADSNTIDASGSNYGRAARAMSRFGICELERFASANHTANAFTPMSASAVDNALTSVKGVRIDWLRFWHRPLGLSDIEMTAIKRHIADGHPVAIGMMWPKALAVADPATHLIVTCQSEDETDDGHCVALVGYDDDPKLPGGGSFVLRNNWGPDWYDHGYARMSYEYIRKFANDLVAFEVSPTAPEAIAPHREMPTNLVSYKVNNLRADALLSDNGMQVSTELIGKRRAGVWFADDQVVLHADKPSQSAHTTITVPATGSYSLVIGATRSPNYGMYTFSIDGKAVGKPLDASWPCVQPTGPITVGLTSLTKGEHQLRVECVGKSLAATGYLLGLDWVQLNKP